MRTSAGAVVVGVGNVFRRDDGVGPAVLALLEERARARPLPHGTVLRECDGDPARLLGLWENAGLAVVVDACFPPSAHPGRVHRWCPVPGATPVPTGTRRHSTHGLGLLETIRLAHSLGRKPGRLVVYAVEGAERHLGTGLTPSVARAVLPLTEHVERDLVRHAEAVGRDRRLRAGAGGTRRSASVPSGAPP
ncbi:hydrogenase maturation protease [Streptomyces anandii]|uniref:Hydrogenase maturation protease n=1 Tax=Streptomyces anandii TaxID=285454 RepID=A0ABW6H7B3_9ACTN